MRKSRIKAIAVILCVTALLSGCQIGDRDIIVTAALNGKQVFKINKDTCTLKEARVYLTNYQNIYGTAYGVDLRKHNFGDDSFANYVKDITLGDLTKIYCMYQIAQQQEMELTAEEKEKVCNAAKEYYTSLSGEEISYLDVSEQDINEYYTRYALAKKLYNSLVNGVNEEVSDDEARVMEIMQIYVTDKNKASEVQVKLRDGEDFATIANNYNELPSIYVTISRDEVPPEVEEVAFAMDNNEISKMIKGENGYYFIKCLNKYNIELTEANKSNIVEKREQQAFDGVYDTFVSSIHSSLNEELWNEFTLNTGDEIVTHSFFKVFEKHFSEI